MVDRKAVSSADQRGALSGGNWVVLLVSYLVAETAVC